MPIVAGGESELRVEADVAVDPAALVHATSQPPVRRWTGVQATEPRLPDLEIWLAQLGGLSRLINRRPGHGLAPAVGQGGSLAVLDSTGRTFAYLIWRSAAGAAPELGVCAYGPEGSELAERGADRVRRWAAEQPAVTTRIEIYPLGGCVPAADKALLTVAKEHIQVIVRTGLSAPVPAL